MQHNIANLMFISIRVNGIVHTRWLPKGSSKAVKSPMMFSSKTSKFMRSVLRKYIPLSAIVVQQKTEDNKFTWREFFVFSIMVNEKGIPKFFLMGIWRCKCTSHPVYAIVFNLDSGELEFWNSPSESHRPLFQYMCSVLGPSHQTRFSEALKAYNAFYKTKMYRPEGIIVELCDGTTEYRQGHLWGWGGIVVTTPEEHEPGHV